MRNFQWSLNRVLNAPNGFTGKPISVTLPFAAIEIGDCPQVNTSMTNLVGIKVQMASKQAVVIIGRRISFNGYSVGYWWDRKSAKAIEVPEII